jgi:hypothetical protein
MADDPKPSDPIQPPTPPIAATNAGPGSAEPQGRVSRADAPRRRRTGAAAREEPPAPKLAIPRLP